MSVYVFPGQGSQKKGMGAEYFAAFPDKVRQADEILGYSIESLCLEDSNNQLQQTQFTQPALFVCEALQYLYSQPSQGTPNYAAGHSLGEYSALFAAGAFDFATGLTLVKKRGELMSQQSGGGMLAVIGLSEGSIQDMLQQHALGSIDLANQNSPQQWVISGPKADIDKARPILESAARMCVPLRVSAAFHSRYMESAKQEFTAFLANYHFAPLRFPVLANVTAKPYENEQIATLLADQMTHPVRWSDSIRWLLSQGETEFTEIGPGNVLTGLIRQIRSP